MPKPKIISSIPSALISTTLTADSDVNLGRFTVQTSVTTRSLHGNSFSVKHSLVLDINQFFSLSIGSGNSETKITTNAIKPEAIRIFKNEICQFI